MEEDLFSWGSNAQLPDVVIANLMQQGINSVSDLLSLSEENVDMFFGDPGVLTLAQCRDLKAALNTLSAPSQPENQGSRFGSDDLEAPVHNASNPHMYKLCPDVMPEAPALEPGVISREIHEDSQASASCLHQNEPHAETQLDYDIFQDEDEEFEVVCALSTSMIREDAPREFCTRNQTCSAPVNAHWTDDFIYLSKEEGNTVRLLLLGKTGNGKSTTGNTILGQKLFNTAPNFGSVTSECERQVGVHGDTRIEIMDSPGLYDTSKSHEEICTIIIQAVAGMHPGPHAVLYVLKVGRFTEEEYSAYRRLKALFDENISNHMILLFTHGDNLERQGLTLEELIASPETPENLRKVFDECGHRCLLINNMADDPGPQVDRLLREVQKLVDVRGGRPYSCPKFSKIGDGLEEEVNKRMEKFEKKDLQRQKYVQELEKRTRQAKEQAEKMRIQIQQKEQERERQLKEKQQQTLEVEQKLFDQLKIQHQLTQQQQKELEQLIQERRRLELEERRLQLKQEELRRREMEEMDRRQKAFETNREREREEDKRREKKRQKEMERIKQRVVEKKEPGFLEKLADVVTHPIRKFFRLFRS